MFTFVLVKPTHYDDDGYPIQWFRSALPSNTLACMNSLAEDAGKREVLGPGVEIEGRDLRRDQSPRVPEPDHPRPQAQGRPGADRHRRGAVEPISARDGHRAPVPRRRAIRSAIGGFHVSGCIAMLPEMPAELDGGAGARHFAVRRRIRGASARRGAARRVERYAEAALQFHGQAAVAQRRAGADPAAQACRAHVRDLFQHRSRPRLPLSVLVLHHHQRAGAQEPLPLRPTISSRSSAPITLRASTGSSSPTTISPATATGRSCSTG